MSKHVHKTLNVVTRILTARSYDNTPVSPQTPTRYPSTISLLKLNLQVQLSTQVMDDSTTTTAVVIHPHGDIMVLKLTEYIY